MIKAIKAYIDYQNRERAMRATFGAVGISRTESRRIKHLAMSLLVHHIIKGETLESIAVMVGEEVAV
jgi:hypothetical protein